MKIKSVSEELDNLPNELIEKILKSRNINKENFNFYEEEIIHYFIGDKNEN